MAGHENDIANHFRPNDITMPLYCHKAFRNVHLVVVDLPFEVTKVKPPKKACALLYSNYEESCVHMPVKLGRCVQK